MVRLYHWHDHVQTASREAKRYLQYLEEFSECPIDMISTGSKRSETIMLRNPLSFTHARGKDEFPLSPHHS